MANNHQQPSKNNDIDTIHHIIPISGLYENWFLDYASYVILERAVPYLYDGLKPVQRRLLHSLKEMDDGRFNKVANVIGHTMKYHPHGDASIGDALVQIGQKNLLIDCQGNWGDPMTGDAAAAPRYIEARLSKFANEVIFNPETTEWQLSYDGRNKEPILLPVKFPLILAQGIEGIAVGLSTKILPHNFVELLDASIGVLNNIRPNVLPDFPTGGIIDCANYNEGLRGSRIRVRAKIQERDKKTLIITEIPFSITTEQLIDSIVEANDKGKIKIKKIEDNTARDIEIVIHLASGISPDVTIDALYAFTKCELSISPNACVIKDDKPLFIGVNDMLIESTHFTKNLLKRELEIKLHELQEKWHFSSLEKIFIQHKIYRDIEEAESEQQAIHIIDTRLEPFKVLFMRAITTEDILKLMEIRIKRITKYDAAKADELLKSIEEEIKNVKHHLAHLTTYAIAWFQKLKDKYGKGRERKSELKNFDKVEATQVALANTKLYANKTEGFIGTTLKKDEYITECSDIDDIIVFREDGKFIITKVAEKTFVGKNIIHVAVFKKNDERTIYNLIYRDGESGVAYLKRFAITSIIRDKEYELTKGTKGSKTLYFTANPNGEAEVVNIALKPHSKLRKLQFDADFSEVVIKGRTAMGNQLTKYPIKKITLKNKGISTLSGRKIWFDNTIGRLNVESRGIYLGEFEAEDKILTLTSNGVYELQTFDLNNHFESELLLIEKYNPEKIYTVVHFEGKTKTYYVKRFKFELLPVDKKMSIISEEANSKLMIVTSHLEPIVELEILKGKAQTSDNLQLNLTEIIDVKGMKAIGNKLSQHQIKNISLVQQSINEETVVSSDQNEPTDSTQKQSNADVSFEITNIDDIEIDAKGQLGLF